MPINRILKHARERRRFDLQAVARFTNISVERLGEFESGDRQPSYRQLERLGDAYGIPAYIFASRDLPNLPEALPDFRKADPDPAQLSPAGMHKIFAAEGIARFAQQLSIELEFESQDFLKIKASSSVSVARARELRASFDDWFASRRAYLSFVGTEDQIFLAALRLFFEVQGLLVNINDAPSEDFLGFYLSDDHIVPTVFVNRSILSKKAQLFTLVHEFAHHILGRSGVSSPFVIRNSVERSCNRFAAEFLAPLEEFRKNIESLDRGTRSNVDSLIVAASRGGFLSKHAAAIRLIESGFIERTQYISWRSRQKYVLQDEKSEESEGAGSVQFGQPHAKRLGELGYLSTYLAKKGIDKKIIDTLDVQAGIGLSLGLQQKAFSLVERRFEIALPK